MQSPSTQRARAREHMRTHARECTHARIYNRKDLESLNIAKMTHIIYKYFFSNIYVLI